MALRFREFVRGTKFVRLVEDDAPPPVPENPEDKPEQKKNSFTSHFQDEFGVDDDTMKAVEPTVVYMALKPFHIAELGYQPAGPIPCQVTPRDDGKFDVKLMLSLVNKRKATKEIHGKLFRYQGTMEDVTVVMDADDIERLKVDGWEIGRAHV